MAAEDSTSMNSALADTTTTPTTWCRNVVDLNHRAVLLLQNGQFSESLAAFKEALCLIQTKVMSPPLPSRFTNISPSWLKYQHPDTISNNHVSVNRLIQAPSTSTFRSSTGEAPRMTAAVAIDVNNNDKNYVRVLTFQKDSHTFLAQFGEERIAAHSDLSNRPTATSHVSSSRDDDHRRVFALFMEDLVSLLERRMELASSSEAAAHDEILGGLEILVAVVLCNLAAAHLGWLITACSTSVSSSSRPDDSKDPSTYHNTNISQQQEQQAITNAIRLNHLAYVSLATTMTEVQPEEETMFTEDESAQLKKYSLQMEVVLLKNMMLLLPPRSSISDPPEPTNTGPTTTTRTPGAQQEDTSYDEGSNAVAEWCYQRYHFVYRTLRGEST